MVSGQMEYRFRSGFCVLIILVCVSLCGFASVCAQIQKPKNVQVAVRAKWSGTPLLLEAGELLASERKDLFWEFIEKWLHSEENDADSRTAKDCLKRIVRHGSSLLSESLASLFEFSLTLRSASPRLVLYRQLAEESLSSFPPFDDSNLKNEVGGASEANEKLETKKSDSLFVGVNPKSPGGKCCWVDTGGALFLEVSELLMWLRSPSELTGESFQQPELFDFDHIHAESSISSRTAILYGALGSDCFKEFHINLVQAAKEGKVMYVVRPVLPSGCEANVGNCGAVGAKDSLNLGGYGVELALKNLEYKAIDDSLIKEGVTLGDPRTEDLSQEVRDFVFSKLLVFGIVSVSLLPVQSLADLTPRFLIEILKVIVPPLLTNTFLTALNQIWDVEIDEGYININDAQINKPYLPLASGDLSMGTAIAICIGSAILSYALAIMSGSPPLLLIQILCFLCGCAYSLPLPFLRWKSKTFMAPLTLVILMGFTLQLPFCMHMQVYTYI